MNKSSTLELPSLTDLMQAGAHFGHKKHRSMPSVRKYIFTVRDRVLVINLEKTREQLEAAASYLTELAAQSALMLFVGTKRQAVDLVKQTAEALEQPYVTQRWFGGTLTNFETIQKRLKRLRELEGLVMSDAFQQDYSKKQRLMLDRELQRLQRTLGGIKQLTRIPDALVIIDTNEEANALTEARRMKVPVVALVDTNADPDAVTKPIVGNDDSARTIELVLSVLKNAVLAGRKTVPVATSQETEGAALETETESTSANTAETKPTKKSVKKIAAAKTAAKKATTVKKAAAKKPVAKPTSPSASKGRGKTVVKKPAAKKSK